VAQAGRSRRELLGTEPGRLECGDLVLARLAPPSRRLPKGWDALPPYRPGVQKVGDTSVKSGRSPALRVPASVLPERFNVLVNPVHPDFGQVRELSRERLSWPPRLVGHLQSGIRNRRQRRRRVAAAVNSAMQSRSS
jgi:hypothetical protein